MTTIRKHCTPLRKILVDLVVAGDLNWFDYSLPLHCKVISKALHLKSTKCARCGFCNMRWEDMSTRGSFEHFSPECPLVPLQKEQKGETATPLAWQLVHVLRDGVLSHCSGTHCPIWKHRTRLHFPWHSSPCLEERKITYSLK